MQPYSYEMLMALKDMYGQQQPQMPQMQGANMQSPFAAPQVNFGPMAQKLGQAGQRARLNQRMTNPASWATTVTPAV